MKICWGMLEGVRLTRTGTFVKGTSTYIYRKSCVKCGEPYLTLKGQFSLFCSISCVRSGENNPFFGKTHSTKSKKKIGKRSYVNQMGSLNPNWKGDKVGFTIYTTYEYRLGLYENIRKQDNTELLEVKCAYCGQWYTPTASSVDSRLTAMSNLSKGEQRLYCSENCKQSCPTYNQKKYPKDFKKGTSREVSTYLRQMVFERDNWECQKCGKTINDTALHCHHIKGYAQNKMLANDVDNCITLCKECHKEVHKRYGCRYVDLQCKEEK